MPTYGWVREDAIEGFLAGTETVPAPAAAPSPRFSCPFCHFSANEVGGLQDHISATHPIDRPCLFLDDQECQADYIVRRISVLKAINATSAEISTDGSQQREIKPAAITAYLSVLQQANVTLTLTNARQRNAAPVKSTYRLQFRIADTAALKKVEAAFLQHIVDKPLSMDTVRTFLDDPRCKGPGADYADGLAKYVTGLLVKERPDGQFLTSPLERYRELFGLSLQSLAPLSRPLSNLVCAVIRFAMNDTSSTHETEFQELNIAARMLMGPSHHPVMVPASSDMEAISRRPVCPIDHGTGRVIDLAVRMARQTRWSKTLSEECRQVAESAALDTADRQKAIALWAVTALRLGSSEDAVSPLAQLSATYPFSSWANPCLEQASTL